MALYKISHKDYLGEHRPQYGLPLASFPETEGVVIQKRNHLFQ